MDDSARDTLNLFLIQYDTLAIATEHDGQPFVSAHNPGIITCEWIYAYVVIERKRKE